MKLINLINARGVIVQFAREKLPAQTAYKLFNFLKETDKDEAFYNDKRTGIIKRYAKKDDEGNFVPDGNGIALIPETAEACKKELLELENTVIELPVRFTIEEFGGLSLSMADILVIEELLANKEDEDGSGLKEQGSQNA